MRILKLVTSLFLVGTLTSAIESEAADSSEFEVRAALSAYHDALESSDIDGILGTFSEEYSNAVGATKSMLAPFFSDPGVMAAMKGQEANLENTIFTVEGDVVTVTPIVYEYSNAPTATWVYRFKKEQDGVWRLINSEQLY